MSKIIPYGKQEITEADIYEVTETLKADFLTQGPRIGEFEDNFAQYVGARYAVAVSNGTAALHLAAIALAVEQGTKVITTPITFAASANCIRYCGGEVIFADIDPKTLLIDFDQVKHLLEKDVNGEIKGIVPVDFTGRPVDLQALRLLADQYNCWILEDACHAPGGFFQDDKGVEVKCGNGQYADISIFSFHPVKHIAAGEGGMITTNNPKLYKKLLGLRTHGITRETDSYMNSGELAGGTDTNDYPGWYMEMQDLGYNYRMTDIQAALGNSQLSRAEKGLDKRRLLATRYYDVFKSNPLINFQSGSIKGHAYHLYVIGIEDRLGLYNFLRTKGIYTQVHYVPVHYMPYYKKRYNQTPSLVNAENYYNQCLSLPIYPTLSLDEQDYVIESIVNYLDK